MSRSKELLDAARLDLEDALYRFHIAEDRILEVADEVYELQAVVKQLEEETSQC